jgi:hypothetical protein
MTPPTHSRAVSRNRRQLRGGAAGRSRLSQILSLSKGHWSGIGPDVTRRGDIKAAVAHLGGLRRPVVRAQRARSWNRRGRTASAVWGEAYFGRLRGFVAQCVNPLTGAVDREQRLAHPGGDAVLAAPSYEQDIALRVRTPG